MADVLSVSGLSVDFRTPRGRVRALCDVSLAVPENTIVGIVGSITVMMWLLLAITRSGHLTRDNDDRSVWRQSGPATAKKREKFGFS